MMLVLSDFIRYSEPITDDDVRYLLKLEFWAFIKPRLLINVKVELDTGMPIEDFIRTKLSPEQQILVYDYLHQNMDELTEQFWGHFATKKAESGTQTEVATHADGDHW